MQFFQIDKNNPEYDAKNDFIVIMDPPKSIANSLKNACYDCHSNETQYPWYSNIAPVSWWAKNHIDHGREHLNFSDWGNYSEDKAKHKIQECYEEVEATRMPILPYIIMHSKARLSDSERNELVDWFKSL